MPLSKECNDQAAEPESVGERNSNHQTNCGFPPHTTGFFLIYIVLTSTRTNKDDFGVLAKENIAIRDPEQYQTTAVLGGSLKHDKAIIRRNGGSWTSKSSQKGTCKNWEMMSSSDLVVVNGDKGIIGFLDLMKAAAEVLWTSGLGSAYKAVMAVNGLSVVVKRMREANWVGKDECEVKIVRF